MPRPTAPAISHAFLATRALQLVSLLTALSLSSKLVSSIIDSSHSPPAALVGILSVVCFAVLYCATTLLLYWDAQLPLLPTAALDTLFFVALMVSAVVVGKPLSYTSCRAATATGGADTVAEAASSPTTIVAAAATVAPTVQEYTAPTATAAAKVVSYTTTTISNAAATVTATLAPGSSEQVQGSDGNMYTISGRSLLPRELTTVETVDYGAWIQGGSSSDCMMMKAVWGFGIALTILFVFSAVMVAFIWKAQRAAKAAVAPKEAEDA